MGYLKQLKQKIKLVSRLPDIVSSHSVHTLNRPLSSACEGEGKLSDVVNGQFVHTSDTLLNSKPKGVVTLPAIVHSHKSVDRDSDTNSGGNSQVAKPVKIPPIATDPETVWVVVSAAVYSYDQAAQKVSKVALRLEEDFNGLQNTVIWIEGWIKRLERRVAVTSEVLQTTNNDLAESPKVVGNGITAEELASIVENMRSTIQEEKEVMILCETSLKTFKEGKGKEVVSKIQSIIQQAAQAEESVNQCVIALQLTLECIRGASNIKISIKDKEVTALEILTETEHDSSTLLKTAIEQKEKIKTLKKIISQSEEKIIQVRETISKEIAKAEAVEKRISDIKNQYAIHLTEPIDTNE